MRYCGFRLATAGSRANNTPRLIPNPPKCRPIAPKRPIFNCFHPMGLQFGGNTTSNRDLKTSQRGKWRHERRDTPTTRRSKASNAAKPPTATSMEGTARPESQGELRDSGPGCGAHGRRRGMAEQRADAPSQPAPHQAPPVRRAPEDPEGADGLRGAALQGNTAQARGRSGRDPDHQRDIKQHPQARAPSARA